MSLIKLFGTFNPLEEFLLNDMDTIFDNSFFSDFIEVDDMYGMKMNIGPDIDINNISVEVDDDERIINIKYKSDNVKYSFSETLPSDVDLSSIEVEYRDENLIINMKKSVD